MLGLSAVVLVHEAAEVVVNDDGIRTARTTGLALQETSSPVRHHLRETTPTREAAA